MSDREGEAGGGGDALRVHALSVNKSGGLSCGDDAQRDLAVLAFYEVLCERLGDGQIDFGSKLVVEKASRDEFDVSITVRERPTKMIEAILTGSSTLCYSLSTHHYNKKEHVHMNTPIFRFMERIPT